MVLTYGWLALPASVSLTTFVLFGWDKLCAVLTRSRVPEARLLWLAAAGGSPGAWVAMVLFRHKVRKQPFNRHLRWITLAQLAVAGVGMFSWAAI